MTLRSAMKYPSHPNTPQASPSPRHIALSPLDSSENGISPVSNIVQSPSHVSSLQGPPQNTPDLLSPNSQSSNVTSPGYTAKVSFDTFENECASMFSYTLRVKSQDYHRTRSTRAFLCAASPDESGSEALDWSLESLVQDGDELIVFRSVDEDALGKDHNVVREEARELMRTIQAKSVEFDPDRKLSLVLEYVAGRITNTLDRLIALYRPDSVVVGMRGKRSVLGMNIGGSSTSFRIGSVSKYCLTQSPVPIIVVRPERKVRKAMEKRKADPKRGRHFEAN